MKVLGIDPGTGRVGWAILEGNRAHQTLIDTGCFETKAGLPVPRRLHLIHQEVTRLIQEFQPDAAAVESLFYFKNAKTVMQVSQARGVVLVALEQQALPAYDYTPLQVKQAVTGYGRADKNQVQQMVKSILKLKAIPKPDDAADAAAVALTHFFSHHPMG